MIPGLAAIRNTATETAIRLTVSLLLYCAPVTKWPYIKNGVGWYDLTEGDWVYSHETFLPGHRYQINVCLKTADGYTFWLDKYYEALFHASVNGTAAEGNTSGSLGLTQQTILAEFACTPPDIYTIMVYDLDAPEPGKTPDYDATTAYPEIYRLDPKFSAKK